MEIRMQGASSETTTGEEKKVRSFTARRHIRKSELNEDQKNELNLVGVADLENASGIIRYNMEQMLALRGNADKQIELVEADCVISPEEYSEMMEEHESETVEESENICSVTVWSYAEELPEKVELTKSEIAEKFGIPLDELEIVD